MPPKRPAPLRPATAPRFHLPTFLGTAGLDRTIAHFAAGAIIYAQGAPATTVLYLQSGTVKLSVLSKVGKEAVVAVLADGDFFGEGCLAGQSRRMGSASAMDVCTALVVEKAHMVTLLHNEPELADRFLSHMLARNIRIEQDLVDQLFNSSEKRLARTLLLLARYGQEDKPNGELPHISQETLAEMIGTTRSRVNFFMNKFRELGFIEYNGKIKVHSSLLSVVLHD